MEEHIEFKREGQSLADLSKSKEDSGAGGEPEKKTPDNGDDKGAGGAPETKPKPFNEDPEVQSYIQRQVESRLTEVEKKHQADLAAVRAEIAAGRKPNVDAEKPPKWFGGNQEQWKDFQTFIEERTSKSGEGVITKLQENAQQSEQAKKEATDYLFSEIEAIKADKTLNPKGLKVVPEELLKVVLENELIDTKGRWNYKAGWRILRQTLEAAAPKANVDKDRKNLAGASVANDKGADPGAKPFKTSEDFKKKRPW